MSDISIGQRWRHRRSGRIAVVSSVADADVGVVYYNYTDGIDGAHTRQVRVTSDAFRAKFEPHVEPQRRRR